MKSSQITIGNYQFRRFTRKNETVVISIRKRPVKETNFAGKGQLISVSDALRLANWINK